MTVWIILPIFLLLIICWLFIAPLELQIDTRIPRASLRWVSVGQAVVTYKNDCWRLNVSVLFFHKQWDLAKLILKKKKKTMGKRKRKKTIAKKSYRARKFFNVIKTFQVKKWQLAIDTGDVTTNARLYALNFITRRHLYINFAEENHLLVIIRNAPWKLAYAFIKQ